MRIALHTETKAPKAKQIQVHKRRFNGTQAYTKQMERLQHWYKRLHERSNNYVIRRPFIHYADRFSKSKR